MKTKEFEAQYGLPSLLEVLYEIRRNPWLYRGICANITEALRQRHSISSYLSHKASNYVLLLADGWPDHSGDEGYPVPATNGLTAREAYIEAEDYWDKSTKYGELRRDLLDYLIERLENGD